MCWSRPLIMAAMRTVASYRTASLSYLVATARCRLRRLRRLRRLCRTQPHGARGSRTCRNSAAGHRASRASCGSGPGPPCLGSCSGYRACVGRHGPCRRRTPFRRGPGPDACAACPDRDGRRGSSPGRLRPLESPPPPSTDHDRHRLLALLDGQMQLGRHTAARTSKAVVVRLGSEHRRAAHLADPRFPRPGGVLVGPAHGGVDIDVPGDEFPGVRLDLQFGKDALPGAVPLPAAERVVHTSPGAVPLRDVTPREARAGPKPYAVDQLPPRSYRRTSRLLAPGQQAHQPVSPGYPSDLRAPPGDHRRG
jgi:hypothetical protein